MSDKNIYLDIVDNAVLGNPVDAGKSIENAINGKISDLLNTYKKDLSDGVFADEEEFDDEEVEEEDEDLLDSED
tara:strand:- start:4231 stop:4452 length:222 start_codon:yes stop_codon:yes gene_type:complete